MSVARNAARTSPPQVAIASSTSASSGAAISASDSLERSDAFMFGLPLLRDENKRRTQSQWGEVMSQTRGERSAATGKGLRANERPKPNMALSIRYQNTTK